MNIKNFILGVAIFILTIAVGVYGIRTIYGPGPDYLKFCPQNIYTEANCRAVGGNWNNCSDVPTPKYAAPVPESPPCGTCDIYIKCENDLRIAKEKYSQKVFLLALSLAILVIVLGTLVFGLESVGAGLSSGGVGILIFGIMGFWEFAQEWLKFLMTLIGLLIVIWLAYYINRKLNPDIMKGMKKKNNS